MNLNKDIEIKLVSNLDEDNVYDLEQIIYDLDHQIQMLSSHADKLDYLIAISSGILSGMLDILWYGDFDLVSSRKIADEKIKHFVIKTSKMLGCKEDDIKSCVAFLEKKNPIPADGNTSDFGGGLQHHLRDFAHHPTIIGLIFSLLTQFTGNSYGTDTNGNFMIVPVPEKSKIFIGKDVPDKFVKGTITWFFHLVSDIAGSSNTASLGGGTGIPGPILSLAKEMSTLPLFKNIKIEDDSFSVFLSKLFNGTLFAKYDENGKIMKDSIMKMDFRGELGVIIELGKQAIPVIANECIVRIFYCIRRMALEIKDKKIKTIKDFNKIDWQKIKPYKNPTLTRMLTIATGVFTTVDFTGAIVTQKYWISVNYVGIGRFAMAVGSETVNYLKIHDVKKVKRMYQDIQANTYTKTDNNLYERAGMKMDFSKFGLTIEQTEILYNVQMYKTEYDIINPRTPMMNKKIISLKKNWVEEWKTYIESGFSDFVQDKDVTLHWLTIEELTQKIKSNDPSKPWFRLVILESMLFEPYFPLSTEKDNKGHLVASKKYDSLKAPIIGYNKNIGDEYLDELYKKICGVKDYASRLRKCYNKVTRELSEVTKTAIKAISVTAISTLLIVATAGAFAPTIATALVGSQFTGLSGAALTSACLAYIGGGAVAVGGAGMAGGTAVIVGGSAILGAGIGGTLGTGLGIIGIAGKKATIRESAKLIVATREIFLNDEHDIAYSNTVYEQYVEKIRNVEHGLVELKLKKDVATNEEKKKLKREIKNAEESIKAMKIARQSMLKYNSSFEIGMNMQNRH